MIDLFMVVDCQSQFNFNVLTKHRVPAAIPLFSKYRIIDVALSIAKESDITNVGIFCNKNYRSLQDHIGSGDRYNLDRRIDGIFILPPKTYNPANEDFLSFERMKEQDEFFRRGKEEYAIIVPSTLIWFPDLDEIFNEHLESKKDISQIVSNSGERLFAFIIKKDSLMNYIDSSREISYRNIVEVFDYSNKETKNTIVYKGNAKYLRTIKDYYNISMEFINNKDESKKDFIKRLSTKEQIDQSSYFGDTSLVKNSFISTGAIIDGEVYNSQISRRVIVAKNAKVVDSVIMNGAVIEEGAVVENAILDKDTRVLKGSIVKGSKREPFVSEKRQIVSSSSIKKVAMLTVECEPFVKRGGLADMVGSLVIELSKQMADVNVFIPLYRDIKNKYRQSFNRREEFLLMVDDKEYHFNVYIIEHERLTYYFMDLYMFFDRDEVYGYSDDPKRFAYFTKAVIEFINEHNIDIDVFHSHDWHTSLLPLVLKQYPKYLNRKTVLTIHNLNYQGDASSDLINELSLDYNPQSERINFLEIGINTFKEITTVSNTYSEELKYDYYSGRLRDSIINRQNNLYGIVNGLNEKINPKDDLEIKAQYSIDDVLLKKEINKEFLANLCGFEYKKDMFIIGSVSRINEIKGFDLILDSLPSILENENIYYCVLGVGNEYFNNRFMELENRYKGRIKAFLTFDGTNPKYIYSGADSFLMPSRIEPCGTSQMIAMKYGTVPIVRQTGGLNDTVISYDPISFRGNGFKFYNSDTQSLISSVRFAYSIFSENKKSWEELIFNGMKSNYSFTKCAKEYLNIYNKDKD